MRRMLLGLLLVWGCQAPLLWGCEPPRSGEVREWKPSDHQPPPVSPGADQPARARPSAQPQANAGMALWSTHCVTCHGTVGRGDGPGRPPGAQVPDMTTAAWQQSMTSSAIADVIRKGRNMMPAFADKLSDPGVDALVGLIRKLGPAPTAPPSGGNPGGPSGASGEAPSAGERSVGTKSATPPSGSGAAPAKPADSAEPAAPAAP